LLPIVSSIVSTSVEASAFVLRAVCVASEMGSAEIAQSFVAFASEVSANNIRSAESGVQSGICVGNILSII